MTRDSLRSSGCFLTCCISCISSSSFGLYRYKGKLSCSSSNRYHTMSNLFIVMAISTGVKYVVSNYRVSSMQKTDSKPCTLVKSIFSMPPYSLIRLCSFFRLPASIAAMSFCEIPRPCLYSLVSWVRLALKTPSPRALCGALTVQASIVVDVELMQPILLM